MIFILLLNYRDIVSPVENSAKPEAPTTPTSRVFRVFVSSTFSDMKKEREALRRQVFPRLQADLEQQGARFQAVDLRWGINEAAAQTQQTMKICLQEVARCQQVTVRPNFIALLGDRYGWRPVPDEIPLAEYDHILRAIRSIGRGWQRQQALLERWYQRDDNNVPPVYVLQPRTTSANRWLRIERQFCTLLRRATRELHPDRRFKYVASSTEQEIARGALLPGSAVDHAFCFLRTIRGLPINHRRTHEFVDLPSDGTPDLEAQQRLRRLKEKVARRLPGNVFHYETHWGGDEVASSHVPRLVNDVYAPLSRVILHELEGPRQNNQLQESEEHRRFGRRRIFLPDGTHAFIGRQAALHRIAAYLDTDGPQALVVHGEPGIGKTTVMAEAVHKAQQRTWGAVIVQ